jgi:hypothetical protein
MMKYGSQGEIPAHFTDDREYREMVERELQMTLLARMREHLFGEEVHTISIQRTEDKVEQGIIISYKAVLEQGER